MKNTWGEIEDIGYRIGLDTTATPKLCFHYVHRSLEELYLVAKKIYIYLYLYKGRRKKHTTTWPVSWVVWLTRQETLYLYLYLLDVEYRLLNLAFILLNEFCFKNFRFVDRISGLLITFTFHFRIVEFVYTLCLYLKF
jgi:hypothetical protein